ncbi:MAG: hypothetical protein N3D18_11585 [Roseococcus sp.]|nr:hypothetical protein [Roseococcus sp.]
MDLGTDLIRDAVPTDADVGDRLAADGLVQGDDGAPTTRASRSVIPKRTKSHPRGPEGRGRGMRPAASAATPRRPEGRRPATEGREGETFVRAVSLATVLTDNADASAPRREALAGATPASNGIATASCIAAMGAGRPARGSAG